jgi:2-(1,2-epoxy-1,2-dihydrophenyl)acetyl-CoA isomerase
MGSAPSQFNHGLAPKQDYVDVDRPVRLDVEGSIAWVTLNRPDSLNAMNGGLMDGLHDALCAAAGDSAVRCVVVRGAGRSFCSGGDVGMMAERRQQAAEASSLGALLDLQHRELERRSQAVTLLHTMPKPTLAVLHGHVVGGGLGVALAADLRIAAAGTTLRVQFSRVGLSGDYGISYFLSQLLGGGKARELLLLDPVVDTDEATRLGLLTAVHPADELAGAADALARRLADGPTIAYGRMKDNLRAAATQSLEEVLRLEAMNQRFSANATVVRSGGPDADGSNADGGP